MRNRRAVLFMLAFDIAVHGDIRDRYSLTIIFDFDFFPQARIRALRMSFIVEKSSALPTLAEVVEKSGHSLRPDHGNQWVAESTCDSPEHKEDPSPSSTASMSSDDPSQAQVAFYCNFAWFFAMQIRLSEHL